jgi:spermidine/putrescine transport system permease protein
MAHWCCLCDDYVRSGFGRGRRAQPAVQRASERRYLMSRNTRTALSCVFWAFVVYLFVPLILMIVMGFKDSKFIGFPIRSWTLDWYLGVFDDAEVLQTFVYSILIAVVSTLISVLIGTWLAYC